MLVKKCGSFNIIAKYHVPDLWGRGSSRFSGTKRLQNSVWWWEYNLLIPP